MKRKWIVPVMLGIAVFLSACSADTDKGKSDTSKGTSASDGKGYHKISAEEGKQMMDESQVTIVDVRTMEEYDEEHMKDAINVPNETIGSEMPEALPDKDATLIVYCRTGVRSKDASDKLVEMGYQNVYDIGGIVDWPYETTSQKVSS